eukprot:CAMPEP_0194751900 /NCGR_PEP_ID=MMETSP0323_2-20130528/5813_1 /TAXON_ID=2866 ORGANISM="Crypthecodinium cohnii, Strain Seligo" /NCGR_SAMPLE_ID=MMETSP0323_2 /ASSEMBLY_ACC=CAM_ASM_000346 /LENGTH=101 /DNA_ID=CAMNT_0039668567 /DNA_START=163 /DNA_END=468 /DNA_ORIENTATION=+
MSVVENNEQGRAIKLSQKSKPTNHCPSTIGMFKSLGTPSLDLEGHHFVVESLFTENTAGTLEAMARPVHIVEVGAEAHFHIVAFLGVGNNSAESQLQHDGQ